ncbi:PREDICTED: uncharacterized protein LOC105359456 [Ceratosolen solmsi marchali]|uniref:Uncharacterized protein LOC105359456 n=1 Tax=Ceratosolen solmsi marchali TaxID=326594 RepID=A0AAJ6VJW5_9HYME|nr:PREDICTED: uncharacterized protein LOC105359456 [Ceratosolen solmsi marchali]
MAIVFPDKTVQFDDVPTVNERMTADITLRSDSITIKANSCDSSAQCNTESTSMESKSKERSTETYEQGYSQSEAKNMVARMNKPDIWDTLLALEQELSPVEKNEQSFTECFQDYPQILNRLSQQFRKTPTRFTEKLVSIIEDSVISESPTKQVLHENSGISLNRMTGEFRKLCKFIEDESMPELAPSLMNMTGSCSENNLTPCEKNSNVSSVASKNMLRCINDTSTRVCTPKMLKCLLTPKNKITSNVNSPINRFTPTADKSFEYWESVCNIMCESQLNIKKNNRKSLCTAEFSNRSMSEMLTICERQMASLDDSAIDIRSSEPCKKTDSDLKVPVQTPRSKSESTILLTINDKMKKSVQKLKNEKINNETISNNDNELVSEDKCTEINETLIFDNESQLLSNNDLEQNTKLYQEFELLKELKNSQKSDQETFEKDFELLYSPENKQVSVENSYDDNEQDCSLLIELAKRRQRCLNTAKLMLEINKEDPISSEDSKCLETLYKLGIQDKTFDEVEDDTKFLNTLSECIDYHNYISVKSQPIINMLNELNSPNNLKNKAALPMKSKEPLPSSKVPNWKLKSQQKVATSKSSLESKNILKNVPNKKTINKLPMKSTPKLTPRVEKKASHSSHLQQRKELKKNEKITALTDSQKNKVISKESQKTPARTIMQHDKKRLQVQIPEKISQIKVTTKLSTKVPQSDKKSHTQSKKSTFDADLLEVVPQSDKQKVVSKTTSNLTATESDNTNKRPAIHENIPNEASQLPKVKLFITPGKSPKVSTLGRKKPPMYFLDTASKAITPVKADYDNVKSPIGLYINGTDTSLIRNIHARVNDRLLTPISNRNDKSPKLKFTLSSKENKSPAINCSENIVLPIVRYQPAKQVHLINDKSSYSPSSLPPNSKIKKLLEPIENTVIIKHEGRIIDCNSKPDCFNSEMSIRVQKMAEKATPIRKKCA